MKINSKAFAIPILTVSDGLMMYSSQNRDSICFRIYFHSLSYGSTKWQTKMLFPKAKFVHTVHWYSQNNAASLVNVAETLIVYPVQTL